MNRHALVLLSVLLGSASVFAQEALPPGVTVQDIPATPLPPNTLQPAPQPAAPAPSQAAPVEPQPAPPEPAKPETSKPASAKPKVPLPSPAKPAQAKPNAAKPNTAKPNTIKPGVATAKAPPITVVFSENLPFALNGKKGSEQNVELLQLGRERTGVLRRAGKVTPTLRADVARFAKFVEHEPQNARFELAPINGEWRLAMRQGVQVDEEATLKALQAALRDPAAKEVKVVYKTTDPGRTLDFFLRRGITSFLGDGTTNYYGSSAARIKNIHVGASRFQDKLFEGKVFSFNQMIGPVTSAGGFVAGLVISGDRTQSGIGGGICQVSTTVFRTLFAAGLPIKQRQNHSYQVRYYDPQGLDATIFQPNLDLKFANDTGGSLWFQADWDDTEARLSVKVFGRPRAETVELAAPRVLATQAPPPPRFIPDDSLAPGRRVQVDWAAPGATIEVERLFKKDGKVVRQDTLRSVYRPWPNIYLVGPSDNATAP